MEPAAKASALWGAIGALLFGVSAQAYQLTTGERISFLLVLLVMVGVGIVTAVVSVVVDTRL